MGIKNSFFEWMRLHFLKNEGKKLRIVGSTSLKHPSGDIDFASRRKGEILLSVHEMSLLGADSPLPDSLLRAARSELENSVYLREFLNMLQHHIAMLRFDAMLKKSNFTMQEFGDLKWKNRFALYNEKFSPEMLRRFFVKLFPDAQISVHPFEPLRIENPAPVFLGKAKLNRGVLLGKNCESLTSAVRVDVSGISSEQLFELKKGGCFLNMKFPLKIKMRFSAKNCESCSQKLSENFWLGNKNFETLKWEKWL